MTDIVQLYENGNKKYLKTHIQAVEGKATETEAVVGQNDSSYLTPLGFTNGYAAKLRTYQKKTEYFAHRGMSVLAPENSLKAFEFTTRHSGIETDIRTTSDGVWVCMHDETVDRTTNGSGQVSNMTLSQIKALQMDVIEKPYNNILVSSFRPADLKVPTFEEYLSICKTRGKVPVVEIKKGTYTQTNYQSLVNLLEEYKMEDATIIISTEMSILESIRLMLPNVQLQQIVSSISDSLISQVASLGYPAGIAANYSQATVTEENINKAKAQGLFVNLWTVPASQFQKLEAFGVDYITTDELSGTRRYEFLSDSKMKNGWKDYFSNSNSPNPSKSFVEELSDGTIHVHLHVRDGVRTGKTVVCELPEWAWPQSEVWGTAILRTSSGVVAGTCDITGYVSRKDEDKANLLPGTMLVGIGWDQGSGNNWARADIIYNPSF